MREQKSWVDKSAKKKMLPKMLFKIQNVFVKYIISRTVDKVTADSVAVERPF